MKNLIYQTYTGKLPDHARMSAVSFKRYHEDTNFIYLNFLDNFTLSEREIRDRLNP